MGNFDDTYGDIRSLEDIFGKPSCDGGICSVQDIFGKPSCDGGIYNLDDIIGLIGYYPPEGKHVCELSPAANIGKNDLFLVSQSAILSSGETGLDSRSVRYCDLSSKLFADIYDALGLGSMAFKQTYQYAKPGHSHDNMYSKVEMEVNPIHRTSPLSVAAIGISTDNIS